ncbi:DUF7344 domain-containing protein [Halorussus salinus]
MSGNKKEDAETNSTEPALEEIPLSLDARLDILANHARRELLILLRDQPEETVELEEAARYILKQVSQERGRQPNYDDVQVELQHHHLPKLADAGIIEYDIRSQTIRYRPNKQLEELHDRVQGFRED